MAEIPVEKKNSLWWLWLLGALLLGALLLWWLLGSDNGDAELYGDASEVVNTSPERMAVASAVDMDNLRVTRLTGDMSFFAEDNSGQEYFIVFDEVPTPNTAKEGRFDINPGNRIDVQGTVRDRSFTFPATVDATIPSGVKTFIYATEIEKD